MSSLRARLELWRRLIKEFFQDQWFDRTRNVRTSGEVSLRQAGIDETSARDSEAYQPARPAHIRQALREIPVQDVSSYTYVDLGSGKGRTLFIAAEQPFRKVVGVELTPVLHAEALANVRTFRRTHPATPLCPVQGNAVDFPFPPGPIVLYMFNPFGVSTVRQVLHNLSLSLHQAPRHIVVILLWPQWEAEVAAMEEMKLWRATEEYRIYQGFKDWDQALYRPME